MNTTGPELELSKGAVSNAILKVAGRGLQNEIEKYRYNRNFGDVVKTQGYNLKSRFVYHVLCAENRPGTKAGQVSNFV